ncbi:uncharacterized protein LOC130674762 [Microplitis mediator]|uniref:uncharacterized protein LOC130674367 n=1 Tax=Microplitis mediator TaxID=375433 RepID=UPI002552394E|nr:uncharacterized protein LOC130674367 [Microplitis mediator]XP_057335662.1 uncharacterized protein LOC130674367 [Microplitis mediator]XP_057336167.1 uncharacterized protein LOC130674762 [Microplitis mediator]XP_057336168.1 uncharacterized protein LOC130674762 [Microplitis mediator]
MTSKIWEDEKDCSCPRACLAKYTNSSNIQLRCVTASYYFPRLDHVSKLQADLKNGIELMSNGKTLKEEEGLDFFEYRVSAVISARDLILDLEKCPKAREIIKGTIYETFYFKMKEKYSEAIDKLMKISDEDILWLEYDPHYEIDL